MEDPMSIMNSNPHADRANAAADYQVGVVKPVGVTCSWISDFAFDSANRGALQHDAEEGFSGEVTARR
jgi:hypothetical protein